MKNEEEISREEYNLLQIILNMPIEKIKEISKSKKVGDYTRYYFITNFNKENVIIVSCIINKNGEMVVPIIPCIYPKEETVSSSLFCELLGNDMAMIPYGKRKYLINLKNTNFTDDGFDFSKTILAADEYRLINNNYLQIEYQKKYPIYDLKNKKYMYVFDFVGTYNDTLAFCYKIGEVTAILPFDSNMKLLNNELIFSEGGKEITLIIPGNSSLDKSAVTNIYIELQKNMQNTSFIDSYNYQKSKEYLQ